MWVSVLIPVYNCSKYIESALKSVLSQTFQNIEIIVVDDGSEDETASLVKKYNRVRYVYQSHGGISAARNRALHEASFELIDFLDADDLMHPKKLEKQVAYLEENSKCDLVFCRYQNFLDLRQTEITPRHQQIMEIENIHLIGALIRNRLFQQYGYFNTRLNYGEDTEWLEGVSMSGVQISHIIDEVLYFRRIHANNLSIMHHSLDEKEKLSVRAQAFRRFMKAKK